MSTITKSPLVLAAETKQSLGVAQRAENEAHAEESRAWEAVKEATQARREASRALCVHESSDTARELSEAYVAEHEAIRAHKAAKGNYKAACDARRRLNNPVHLTRDELIRVLLTDGSIIDSNGSQDFEDAVEAARQACRKQVAAHQALSQSEQSLEAAKEAHNDAVRGSARANSVHRRAIDHLLTIFLEIDRAD